MLYFEQFDRRLTHIAGHESNEETLPENQKRALTTGRYQPIADLNFGDVPRSVITIFYESL